MKRSEYVDIDATPEQMSEADIDLYDGVMNFIRIEVNSALRRLSEENISQELIRQTIKETIARALAEVVKGTVETNDPSNPFERRVPAEEWERIRRVLEQYPTREDQLYPNGPTWITDIHWSDRTSDRDLFTTYYLGTPTPSEMFYTDYNSTYTSTTSSTVTRSNGEVTAKVTIKTSPTIGRDDVYEIFKGVMDNFIKPIKTK